MKILFFVSSFPALSETFILNQITGMIDRGHEVQILATKKVTTAHHPDVENYQLMDKVTYIEIPKKTFIRGIKGLGNFMKILSKNPKRAFHLLNGKKNGQLIYSLRPLYVAPYFEENRDFDVIIGHYGYNLLLLEIIKNSYPTFPKLVGFFHGYDLTGFVQRFGSKIYRPLQQKTTTKGLPISRLLDGRLKELKILVEQTQVHHMGINVSDFYYTQPIEMTGVIQLLIVGRLTEKKGIDNAIEAVSILKQKNKKILLQIIGDGEQKVYLQQLITKLQLTEEVRLKGWQTQDVVKKAVREADIILLPSKVASTGDKEGIPVSLMESLATGKLVISTFHSGIPEMIQDGVNGWLIEENDSNGLAQKIEEVSQLSLDERITVSKEARKSIFLNFNIDKLNDQLIRYILNKE